MKMRERKLDEKHHIEVVDATIRVVKTSNGEIIPEDEPVILFRARDHLALYALQYYALRSEQDGCNDYHMEALARVIENFRQFRKHNPDKMKQPGITRGL